MTRRVVRIATRGSRLARLQAERVGRALVASAGVAGFELVVVRTTGDAHRDRPIGALGTSGVFVAEVQRAVLEGAADVAVHSAKDLPSEQPAGLVLAAVPERLDPRDALVGARLAKLPPGSVIATGSPRRRAQLAWLRPDLCFEDLRGNLDTRLERAGSVGAVVVAMAALERLGLADRADEVLHPALVLPQVGQGALAVEGRAGDTSVLELVALVDEPGAHRELEAERAFLAAIGGSCDTPLGALARQDPATGALELEGLLAAPDGSMVVRARATSGPGAPAEELGRQVASRLLDEEGGSMLLQAGGAWDVAGRRRTDSASARGARGRASERVVGSARSVGATTGRPIEPMG
jgi:hydroxymethylbilane synthase